MQIFTLIIIVIVIVIIFPQLFWKWLKIFGRLFQNLNENANPWNSTYLCKFVVNLELQRQRPLGFILMLSTPRSGINDSHHHHHYHHHHQLCCLNSHGHCFVLLALFDIVLTLFDIALTLLDHCWPLFVFQIFELKSEPGFSKPSDDKIMTGWQPENAVLAPLLVMSWQIEGMDRGKRFLDKRKSTP